MTAPMPDAVSGPAGGPLTGRTRVVVMLGDPITQVKTPAAFNAWAAQQGHDVVMVPLQVDAQSLPVTIEALRGWPNCAGAVVTYPHKQAVAGLVDASSDAVTVTGACNVVRREADGRLVGAMTDGAGFVVALIGNGHRVGGLDVRLIGAGGAGTAIALALVDAGAGRLVVADTDRDRLAALMARIATLRPEALVTDTPPPGFVPGLVCNATPVGMNGDTAHPWPLDDLPPGCIVADIVPDPPETPWIIAARARGHPVQTGPEMVAAQLPAVVAHLLPSLPGSATC